MPDEKATAATGATPEDGATPDAAQQEAQPAMGGDVPAQAQDEPLGEPGMKALAEERKAREVEKAARREAEKRAADLERRLKEITEKDLSEQEKTAQKLAALEAERETWRRERQVMYVSMAVSELQPRLGLIDVDAVVRLLDWDDIDFDDDGDPTNMEDLVRALVKEKPYLGGQRPTQAAINAAGGVTGAAPPRLTSEELEAAKASGLTPERYAALKGVRTLDDWMATRRQSS